ncbi:MAG: hypothetical protein M3Y87_05690 [Myxococcota bacterium]|nr:hypothetical protein [Myxococcota bacterium]
MQPNREQTRSLLHDTRGAAYTEVIIMMPVFISLFVGIGFFHEYYLARMNAATEARRCAWAYSNGGCDQVPDGCAGVIRGTGGAESRGSSPAVEDHTGDVRDGVAELDREMPMSASRRIMEAILGSSTTARGSEPVQLPDWVGGGSREATCGYTVVCNEREHTLQSLVREAFCNKAGSFGAVLGC